MEAMKSSIHVIVLILIGGCVFAQSGEPTAADSDPEAVSLLDAMDKYLSQMSGLHAQFSMTFLAPGTDTLTYSGTLDQTGKNYHIDVDEYSIISDGQSRWVYYREANEVNLYSDDDSENSSSPLAYLRLYQSGDFLMRVADEYAGAGERSIELKPLDRMSDYIKVRVTLNATSNAPERIEVFEKGGNRTDLRIDEIKPASNFPEGHFVFRESDHPGVHVEDLRID